MPSHDPARPHSSTRRNWQTLAWLGTGIALLWLLWLLSPVLTPFLLAFILAYMLQPGVERLYRRGCPRALAVILMLLVLLLIAIGLVLIVVPVVQQEILLVQSKLPNLLSQLNGTLAPKLKEWFGLKVNFDGKAIRAAINKTWINNSEDVLSLAFDYALTGGTVLLTVLGNLILVPMVLFYLLMDWTVIFQRMGQGIPRRWQAQVLGLVQETDSLLAQYLRGQLAVMLCLAAYYALALYLAGIELAVPVGVLTGLLIFIPYVGYAFGFMLALLSASLDFTGWNEILTVIAIYGLGQILESFWLTPRWVGERIGLHPLAVIFALLACGQLFGFFGILLALPMSAAILVGLRALRRVYLRSEFYNRG
ncbi:AI-2E family transporter [Parvibium lacunae]|uniref:AI-2E family transporter n=1 Tax=Parvibium lacunae TaxID=1888893 RepID=A0A368L1E4_9BURK|nr:AI-2E family transporter [Parvibium lacunae]RCS57352.1 AI-2E family transporter [Parvibium lacunae]